MSKESETVSGEVVFSVPIVGADGVHRGVLDHGDGRFTIAKVTPGSPQGVAEATLTIEQAIARAILVVEGNPDALEIKGLGRQLASAFLLIMKTIGAVEFSGPVKRDGENL